MKRFAALCLTLILLVGLVPVHQAEAASLTLTVKGGWLRLRDKASFNGDTIASYYTGTKVTVLDTHGAWYYVRTPDGNRGYMYGNYLTSSGTGSSGSVNENITAYVFSKNGKGVRMRSGPGTGYGVIRLYDVGTMVKIISSGTYWHYVNIDGEKGYMMADYLSYRMPTPDPVPDTDTDVDVAYTAYVTSSNGKSVRLRKGAGTAYGVIDAYAVGTQVLVHGKSGSWSQITVAGQQGYMMSKYLTTVKPGTSTPSTPDTSTPSEPGFVSYTAYVVSENGKGVRWRLGPSTSYGIISTLDLGTKVKVVGKSGQWNQIEFMGTKGYIMSEFLASRTITEDGSFAPDTYTAYVTSENGKGVYLRKGAGTSYASMGLYSVGTQVTVLQHGVTWDRVRIGSREGYMMNKYLTTTAPGSKTISGVTISDAYPVPGETLWANVTPSGANVTYEWMTDNGLLLATTPSLAIKDDDVGLRIRVRVTGANGYSGSAVSSFATVQKEGIDSGEITVLRSVSIDNGTPTVGQTLTAGLQPTGATATYRWIRGDGAVVGTAKAYTVQPADVGYALWVEASGTGSYTGTVTSSKTAAVGDAAADKPFAGTASLNFSAIMPGVTLRPSVSVNCQDITYHWYVGGTEVSNASQLSVTEDMAGKDIKLVVKPAAGTGYAGQVESNECTVLSTNVATPTDL